MHALALRLLASVQPQLRRTMLVSQPALAGLLGLDAQLPDFDNARYLECRLGGAGSEQVDYLLSLTALQAGALAARTSDAGLQGAGMAATRRLAESWTSSGSQALRRIPIAWLEFDDVAGQMQPRASVCVCLAPSYSNPHAPIQRPGGDQVVATGIESARVILDRDLCPAEADAFRRCIDRLPEGAHWIHLSLMTARAPEQIKLYGVFPTATLPRYLRDVEWPGTLTTLSQFLQRYQAPEGKTGAVYVDLPLATLDGRSPVSLGLCFSQQQLRPAPDGRSGDRRRAALLAALVRDGLCTADQTTALAAWPSDGDEGPSIAGAPATTRWLDIKLVYGDAQPLLAKAYLGFARRRPLAAWGWGPDISPAGRATPGPA